MRLSAADKPSRQHITLDQSSGREDDILQRLAENEAVNVVRHLAPTPRHHSSGSARAMRGHQDVRQLVKGMTRWPAVRLALIRVLPPHIQRRSANPSVAQRGVNGVLIDDRATRDVDERFISAMRRESISPSVSVASAVHSTTKSQTGSIWSSSVSGASAPHASCVLLYGIGGLGRGATPQIAVGQQSQVRTRLLAGGSEIRTLGPSRKEKLRKAERTKPAWYR